MDVAHRLPSPDTSAAVEEEVAEWVRQRGRPLGTSEPDGPHAELASLRDLVGDAVVVGLGGSTYGAHEQFTFGHRLVRYLVEELGFRSVATEEDWDIALDVNRYVLTGEGDVDTLAKSAGVPWRVGEMRDAIAWIRGYNEAHADDPVRFVGVGVIDTKASVYDEVTAYVEANAPDLAGELREIFELIRPARTDHVPWFIMQVKEKAPFVERARQALRLVQEVPHAGGDLEHDLVTQHVRQIVAFYEHYAFHLVDDGYRDEKMAENLRWWHQHTGDKIVYWSTNAHSVRSDELTISVPPRGKIAIKPTGGHLAELFGDGYFSIGLTFDHGVVNSGWSAPPFTSRPLDCPAPAAGFAERPFSNNGTPRFLLSLAAPAPDNVRKWLDGPAKARVIGSICDPSAPDEHYMTGGSLTRWYDAVVHHFTVTPAEAL
jgi:erythromycin esterase